MIRIIREIEWVDVRDALFVGTALCVVYGALWCVLGGPPW